MAREPDFEERWRDELARKVAALFGESIAELDQMVLERLELGAERYGDDDFMCKDMIAEALEETADCVVYALLESEKRRSFGHGDGVDDLMHAAIHAAMADRYFRRARGG